jgi:Uncharacterized conserved protein
MAFLHTYSIIARDEASGQLGVAVQSHWFAVGVLCPWVEAGVGAVATQSMVEVDYGPRGLAALRSGQTPQEALQTLLAQDEGRELRQVAMLDARGLTAVHTGSRCIGAAGHCSGPGFSVQANMMKNDTVWPAMAAAYQSARGSLAERLLAALKAAQAAGGDIRGKQSAALRVVDGVRSGQPWKHLLVDLRVDDSPDPLAELERLLRIHQAYELMNAGDDAITRGDALLAREKSIRLPAWHRISTRSLFGRRSRWRIREPGTGSPHLPARFRFEPGLGGIGAKIARFRVIKRRHRNDGKNHFHAKIN